MSGPASQIEYYARALRAPRISDSFARFGDQARDAGWSHEQYLAAVLSREVSEREASGAGLRIKAARFPGHKTLEDFNFDHQPGADRNLMGLSGHCERLNPRFRGSIVFRLGWYPVAGFRACSPRTVPCTVITVAS